jgi:heme exporter protein C
MLRENGMKVLRWILLVIALGLLWKGFTVAMSVPPDGEQGNIQRIFYYHLPAWIAMSLCFFANLAASIVYLATRNKNARAAITADSIAVTTAEVGVLFCTVGLVTGSLWARYAWGIWWTWDARLTATLVLWLIYVSYLLLRRFAAGPQMRTLCAVLAIFGYVDVPIVYMSTRWWRTQHPGPVIGGGPGSGLAPSMLPAVNWNVYAWLAWALFIVLLRYGSEKRAQVAEQVAALRSLST